MLALGGDPHASTLQSWQLVGLCPALVNVKKTLLRNKRITKVFWRCSLSVPTPALQTVALPKQSLEVGTALAPLSWGIPGDAATQGRREGLCKPPRGCGRNGGHWDT